jgi:hypothetical protein
MFDHDVSAVASDGRPRKPNLEKLKWLVGEYDHRGLVADVTPARSVKRIATIEAHQRAVEVMVPALKPHRNWHLDLANERDVRDARYASPAELKKLRELVRRLDPSRLVAASFGGHDLGEQDVREALQTIGLDFLSRHRPRTSGSPAQTEARTRECLKLTKQLVQPVPVHHQESFRRGYGRWEPSATDFLTDLRGAESGGAAGWCFHNGAQQGGPHRGAPPRKQHRPRPSAEGDSCVVCMFDCSGSRIVGCSTLHASAPPNPAMGTRRVFYLKESDYNAWRVELLRLPADAIDPNTV